MLSRKCWWKLIVIRFCLKVFKDSIGRKWWEILQHNHMCPVPSETPTTTFGRSTSCEVPGMALLTAGSYRNAAIYSWVQKTAACSSTATGLKPWDLWLGEEPTRLPNTLLQEWKTAEVFRLCAAEVGHYSSKVCLSPVHHSNPSQCARISLLFPVSSFPTGCNNIKKSWAAQQLWAWLLAVRLAWESSTDAAVMLLGPLGSPVHARKHCMSENLSWKGRWA